MASLLALCAPGDEVLTPDPGWPGYDAMIAAANARQVRYSLTPGSWQPDLEALEAAATSRAKVLLLNSPSNPGGAVFPRATVAQLVAFAAQRNLWILSDECYDELIYAGEHVSPATLDSARSVVVGTCSKAYAMTGWRVGWVVAPPGVAAAVGLATTAAVNNLPLFVQRAAEAALTGPQECVRAMAAEYKARRDLALGLLEERQLVEYMPEGAFYLLINAAKAAEGSSSAAAPGFDSVAFAERLLTERGIALGPGDAFGARTAGYVRVSLASSRDDLRAGISGLLDCAQSDVATRETR
jgi:aspartate aminotransferase/aminotransferase